MNMKKYSIEMTEILSRTIEVEACDEQGAMRKLRQMYRDSVLVLDASDYVKTEFRVKNEKTE